MEKKNILIVSFSDFGRDPRVRRQVLFLKDHYRVTAAGFGNPSIEGVDYCPIEDSKGSSKLFQAIMLKLQLFRKYYWSLLMVQDALKKLKGGNFDLIIANDADTLPLALLLAKQAGAKVLYDAHEYEPRHPDDPKPHLFSSQWKIDFFFKDYYDYVYRKYLSRADAMVTVCESIAQEYRRNYGVVCNVITNAPFYEDLKPTPVVRGQIRLVHHGGTNTARRLEMMISLMDLLDKRFTLDLMLVPNDRDNWLRLKTMADHNPRVRFREPVPMQELPSTLNQYDVGLFLLWPADFHYRVALPNKLFEFIQGRLAVAIWPSPEMARIVRETGCGVISEDFTIDSAAKVLNSLTAEDVQRFKQQSHQAASRLCAEANQEVLLRLVDGLIGS